MNAAAPVDFFNPYADLQAWKNVLKHPNLSDAAKLTYNVLAWHSGKNGLCYPSIECLAKERGGISDRAVRRHLRELVTHGLIQIEHRFDTDGRQKASLYRFIKRGGRVTEVSPPSGTEMSRGRVTEVSYKGNHHQKVNRKKALERSGTTARSSAGEERRASVKAGSEKPPKQAANPKTRETPKPSISKSDDDEKPKPAYASALDKLTAICESRGDPLMPDVAMSIERNLEKHRVSWQEFLDTYEDHLQRVRSPVAFLITRAQKFRTTSKPLKARLLNEAAADPPKPEVELCPKCHSKRGEGIVSLLPMRFCECATPEFIAEREAKEREKEHRRQATRLVRKVS